MIKFYIQLIVCLLVTPVVKAQHIEILQNGKATSIRGLSVVNDQTAWVSGSKGTIALTNDGGKTWNWMQLKGYEKADFRDIEAFSSKEAIIMSSGTPALILKTKDGGATWQEKYRNADTTYFFDAMDFAGSKHGIILGDPINNKFLLMETNDGGETWHPFNNPPQAMPNEAAFAASGTCLRMDKKGIDIVSGGSVARVFTLTSSDTLWKVYNLPLTQGKNSQGAFSIANGLVMVGGDYANDKLTEGTACYTNSYANIKTKPFMLVSNPAGFQSCVELIQGDTYLSTGTPGSGFSADGGKTWTKIDGTSFNVCRKAKHGKLVLLAGNKGKIGIYKL